MKSWNIRKLGFTLVELLIVVIIIGILAAVAIPQFGQSSDDARLSALDSNLATVRNAIELYYHQHSSAGYPGVIKLHKAGAAAAAAHTSAQQAFVYQLTMYSDAAGNTADTLDKATYPYGPYIKTGVPSNPLPASGAVATPSAVTVGTETAPLTAEASPATGWRYSSATGQFIANNSTYATR